MTIKEKAQHEKLLSELREIKKANRQLYCEYYSLRDAVVDVVAGWRNSRTPPTEKQMDSLLSVYKSECDGEQLEHLEGATLDELRAIRRALGHDVEASERKFLDALMERLPHLKREAT